MSWDYINKNGLGRNVENSKKGGEKFKELMKDPKWRKAWIEKTTKASNTPENNASRSKKMKKKLADEGNWWIGREHTAETKAKMSESAKERMARCGNPAQGKVWVFHEGLKQNKSIPSAELQKYLDKGWCKGRKMTF